MKIIRYLTAAIIFLLSSTTLVQAQETQTQWKALNEDAMTLYRQGQYVQAVVVAKQALEAAQASVGPDHPDTAVILNSMAVLGSAQGDYASAEPLYTRSLEIGGITQRSLGARQLV